MAYITVVSGGSQPVFATDVLNPVAVGTATAATPVNFQGPKLDFFSLTANSSLAVSGAGNAAGYVSNVLQAIQQTSTVAMYQVNPTANTVLNIATFPTAGFANTATLLATAQAANGAIGWASATGYATFTTWPTPA